MTASNLIRTHSRPLIRAHSRNSRSSCLHRAAGWLAVACGILLVAGCDRGLPTAQVTGRIQFSDGSVPEGMIRFIRFEPAPGSNSPIRKTAYDDFEPDGSFDLFTKRPGDGVFYGDYVVTLSVFKDHMGRQSAIPAKYTKARSSPFRVTVQGDMLDQVFELEKE